MSSLRGLPGERWTLAHAIDAMADAVRQVGRPALIWVLGHAYPGLTLLAGSGGTWAVALVSSPHERIREEQVSASFSLLVFTTLFFPRFIAGMAALGAPEAWTQVTGTRRAPRLRDAWRAGRGLGWAALGLWLQILMMLVLVAFVALAPPLYALEHFAHIDLSAPSGEELFFGAIVLGPFVGLVLAFGFVLSVIYQLALQSLVHNRRGVTSALLHGWRIARAEPWATARAVLVDFLLTLTAYTLMVLMCMLLVMTCIGMLLVWLPCVLMPGFNGIARAAYWARVYRELGGLSPADHVPGLTATGVVPESTS